MKADRLDSHLSELRRTLSQKRGRCASTSISCCRSSTAKPIPWAAVDDARTEAIPASNSKVLINRSEQIQNIE